MTRAGAGPVVALLVLAGCSTAALPLDTDTMDRTVQPLPCDAPVEGVEPRGTGPPESVQEVLVGATRSMSGGAVVAIGAEGAVRYCAAGSADPEGSPLVPDHVFRIASITKTFTAVLVLQLVEEGLLELDDPVTDVLPGLDLADDITVRQLLDHSSGLHDFLDASFDLAVREDWDRSWTSAEILERVALEEREFEPPGTDRRYSNTNYLVAGLIVEELTGRPFAEVLRTRITAPLGMTHTALGPDGPEPVTGFSPIMPAGSTDTVSYRALETSTGAAGGMVSTAEDLMTFAEALTEGRLVSPESWSEMTDVTEVDDGIAVGLGLMEDEAGRLFHEGDLPGYRSLLILPSAAEDGVVVLANDSYINVFLLSERLMPAP
ncbi:serine hydrolase domain-containing protein [Ornithinimicrobium sp. W1665]